MQELLQRGKAKQALLETVKWRAEKPGDVLALVALGESLEKNGDLDQAARAYGSLIDLFPSRADLRRYAGNRLEALGKPGLELAVDTYRKAVSNRPDHPTGYRHLAYALVKQGDLGRAVQTLQQALRRRYRSGSFSGFQKVLRQDLGIIGAVWLAQQPRRRTQILDELGKVDVRPARRQSLRFVLSWETDANDVDLHVYDRAGAHAYYGDSRLPSGGELYSDVTTGYGPECFAIAGRARGYPYRLQVHYYSRGPMGYGMGTVQGIRHDGRGHLRFIHRPFVALKDGALVELGEVGRL